MNFSTTMVEVKDKEQYLQNPKGRLVPTLHSRASPAVNQECEQHRHLQTARPQNLSCLGLSQEASPNEEVKQKREKIILRKPGGGRRELPDDGEGKGQARSYAAGREDSPSKPEQEVRRLHDERYQEEQQELAKSGR